MPITTLKQREASSSTPFGITPIPDGVISDVDRAMTLGVYWITSAPPPTTDTTGFDIADVRRLPVYFMQVARPLLYDDMQYPVAYDDRHYLPEFTGAVSPIFYDRGRR